jgi:hypothetical protein
MGHNGDEADPPQHACHGNNVNTQFILTMFTCCCAGPAPQSVDRLHSAPKDATDA